MSVPQHEAQHTSTPSHPAAKPAPNAQPWAYKPPTREQTKQPRYTPSNFYLSLDILVKLIGSASLLGILIVLVMILREMKKASDDVGDSLRELSRIGSISGSPIMVDLMSGTGPFNPIYMKAAS